MVVAATVALGFGVAPLETGITAPPQRQQALYSTAMIVLVCTTAAALVVLATVLRLSIDLRRRDYALWQIAGVEPDAVRRIVTRQSAVLGVTGSVLGSGLAVLLVPMLTRILDEMSYEPSGEAVRLGIGGVVPLIALVTAVTWLSSLPAARSASRTPPITVLRESTPPAPPMTWVRWTLLAASVAGVVLVANGIVAGGDRSRTVGLGIFLAPMVAVSFAVGGSLLFPRVVMAWTSLLPDHLSHAWYLARHGARHKTVGSSAGITTLLLATAFLGSIFAVTGTATNWLAVGEADPELLAAGVDARNYYATDNPGVIATIITLIGGPVLLAVIAAAMVVLISGRTRHRETALLRAAGVRTATIVAAAGLEGLILALTALLLALVAWSAARRSWPSSSR
ncbi:FtsX-like permease family protein [Rathayibacter sp. VKM Ac-2630]|uniref:FtsX-like permease family protein n=1 Tax=Rathayibacter sp. VKM Ac-2630 TaxID=1938617 RepID=UPI000981E820|nr:FtsX-like permease family protein [Rathayibacter sp. VKM Ac-2630]OOB89642.1 hypothetical protein B0T42_16320 [Rathayibacter sp. VKM Ac-2630]